MSKDMRDVYTDTLIEMAEKDSNIVILEADLMRATGSDPFRERFPERTFNVGVAEANMVSIASGLSAAGKIPFPASFGCFAARRTFDQFFLSANYARLNVKLIGTDPGVSAAYNGGTHMPFEDIGIMRIIPGLVVFEPADPVSLKKLLYKSAYHKGCTYMRLQRKGMDTIYDENEEFELGKGKVLKEGNDLTIIASGYIMVPEALKAAELLEQKGVSSTVIDMHTIKPIDAELVLKYAEKTGAVVTCENHQIINGLGSAVAEVLSENLPTPLKRIGINDEFGEVGTLDYLKTRFALNAFDISKEALNFLSQKTANKEKI